jgi:hypothetical protein
MQVCMFGSCVFEDFSQKAMVYCLLVSPLGARAAVQLADGAASMVAPACIAWGV